VLAFVLPPIIRPDTFPRRPRSRAHLAILDPRGGQVLRGDPAIVHVRLSLTGGKIVAFTSSRLRANEGHVHLYLDRALVSMSYGLTQTLDVPPGPHTLLAEYVAVDHAPFDPRVEASSRFHVVRPSS
jgi:hypothetical protein